MSKEKEQKYVSDTTWLAVKSAMEHEGLSYKQVSDNFGIPLGTVKAKSFRDKWATKQRAQAQSDALLVEAAINEAKSMKVDLTGPDVGPGLVDIVTTEKLWIDSDDTEEDEVLSPEVAIDRALKIASENGVPPNKLAAYLRELGQQHEFDMAKITGLGRASLLDSAKNSPEKIIQWAGNIDKFDKLARRTLRLDVIEEQSAQVKVVLDLGDMINKLTVKEREADGKDIVDI